MRFSFALHIRLAFALTVESMASGRRFNTSMTMLVSSRKGQHSIRINDQWRVCFVWADDGAHDVELVDYH